MRRLVCLMVAAGALAASAAAGAPPEDPVGEFRGVMHVRRWTYDVGLRVKRTPDGYAATYDWITLDLRDIPLNGMATAQGPAFERKSPPGTFVARFDARTGWHGEWRRWGQVFPMEFHRAPLPPAPLLPRPDRQVLVMLGVLIMLQLAGIAWLTVLRRRLKRVRDL